MQLLIEETITLSCSLYYTSVLKKEKRIIQMNKIFSLKDKKRKERKYITHANITGERKQLWLTSSTHHIAAARSCSEEAALNSSEPLGAIRNCSELLGTGRSYSELLGAARSYSELLGGSCSEQLRATRNCSGLVGAARRDYELLGANWSCSEQLGATWNYSELLGTVWGFSQPLRAAPSCSGPVPKR